MLRVGLAVGQAEAQQSHHRGTGIGEVIEGVGGDSDGAADGPGEEFNGKKEQIQANAHKPAELAVGLPQGGGSQSVPIADEQSGEKFDHTMYPFPAVIRRG